MVAIDFMAELWRRRIRTRLRSSKQNIDIDLTSKQFKAVLECSCFDISNNGDFFRVINLILFEIHILYLVNC